MRERWGSLLLSIAASLTSVVTLVTLAVPDWIEEISGIDPDRGDGSLEWLLVVVLAVVSAGLWAATWWRHRRWRRTTTPAGRTG
jgi:hypothetical protein